MSDASTEAAMGSHRLGGATLFALSARHVTKRFPGVLANDRVDFDLLPGEVHTLLGENGAGKSTLLNVMGGLLTCSVGEVTLLGERLDRMNARQRDQFRANHVGYVFQRFNLVPYLNAIENIELASTFAAGKQRSSVREEATDLLHSLNVIPSDWSKPTSHLSMGQQQRVALARALAPSPKVLLLDEPYEGLAPTIVKEIESIVEQIREVGITTIIVEQNALAVLKYSDRAVILDTGVVVYDGPAKEVLENEDLRNRYLAI